MAGSRAGILTAAGLGIAGTFYALTPALCADGRDAHRSGAPRAPVEAPHRHSDLFAYRLNPHAGYHWFFPGGSFEIGNWGSRPSHFPNARVWSRSGEPTDLACNMPSSPCWDQDRE